ncbi:hypothetical protein CR513_17268, partial [Mucuna pruriens]
MKYPIGKEIGVIWADHGVACKCCEDSLRIGPDPQGVEEEPSTFWTWIWTHDINSRIKDHSQLKNRLFSLSQDEDRSDFGKGRRRLTHTKRRCLFLVSIRHARHQLEFHMPPFVHNTRCLTSCTAKTEARGKRSRKRPKKRPISY